MPGKNIALRAAVSLPVKVLQGASILSRLHLPRPLRYPPPLALGLPRAAGMRCLLCPPPVLPSGGCPEDREKRTSWFSPASTKQEKTAIPDGCRCLSLLGAWYSPARAGTRPTGTNSSHIAAPAALLAFFVSSASVPTRSFHARTYIPSSIPAS